MAWASINKTYITVAFTHFFSKLYKTKICDVHLRIQLMLQTRVRYTLFVARQSYQRGIFVMVSKWTLHHITIRWGTASWRTRNCCERRYSLFYFRLVIKSAYTQVCISLSPTSTRSATFGKGQPWHEFSSIYTIHNVWFTLYTIYGQFVSHAALIRFD